VLGDDSAGLTDELQAHPLALEGAETHRQPRELQRPRRLARAWLEEQEGRAGVVVALAGEQERANVLGQPVLESGAHDERQAARRRDDHIRAHRRQETAGGDLAEAAVARTLPPPVGEGPLPDRVASRASDAERNEHDRLGERRERHVATHFEVRRRNAWAAALEDDRAGAKRERLRGPFGRRHGKVELAARGEGDPGPFELGSPLVGSSKNRRAPDRVR